MLAGFIGQFGRRFAEHLIDRGKKRREAKRSNKQSTKEPVPITEDSLAKEVKASLPGEKPEEATVPAARNITPELIEEMAQVKKKEDKALSKVEKKRLKAEKKKLK